MMFSLSGNIVFASGCTALAVSLMRRKGAFTELFGIPA